TQVELHAFNPNNPAQTGIQIAGFEKTHLHQFFHRESRGRTNILSLRTEFHPTAGQDPLRNFGYYPSRFNVGSGTFLGTGSGESIQSEGAVAHKWPGVANQIRAEHFKEYTARVGSAPKSFDITIVEDKTLKQNGEGVRFEQTKIGRHVNYAARRVGIQIQPGTVEIEDSGAWLRVRGKFEPLSTAGRIVQGGRGLLGGAISGAATYARALPGAVWQGVRSAIPGIDAYDALKAAGGGSALAGVNLALRYNIQSAVSAVRTAAAPANVLARTVASSAASGIQTAAATLTAEVSAGAAATAAVTVAAIAAAAGAVTWAVVDTRRALRGEETATDVATKTWSSRGFTGTLQLLWGSVAN
ncbi:MAG: hypothetical protein ACREQW_11305, partial [Candidatus Binatia bacterium]